MLRLSLKSLVLFLLLGTFSSTAYSYTHNYIQTMRSSTQRTVFVQQAVEAEYGEYQTGDLNGESQSSIWKGYGFRNAVGMELMKFIQFSVQHTFLNMASRDSSSERIGGSRLAGEAKFSFGSPMGNLEMGLGALVSRYDYQKQLDHTSLYGSGMYYTLGVNYFMNSQISVFGNMKQINEQFVRNSGAQLSRDITTSTTAAGFGVSIWL